MAPLTADQQFAAIVAALSLLFTVVVAAFGLTVRVVRRITRNEERLAQLAEDARDDRRATNERLTWLERNVWPKAGA